MSDHYDSVKGVDWREVLPATVLTRAFSVAVSVPVLLLASVGVSLTISGWLIADSLLIPDAPTAVLVGATAEDVISLMRKVKRKVRDEQGVDMQPEVGLLGKKWEEPLS